MPPRAPARGYPPVIPVRVDPQIQPHYAARNKPLAVTHPLAQQPCPICDDLLGANEIALVFIGRFPDQPTSWTSAAVAIHEACIPPEVEP